MNKLKSSHKKIALWVILALYAILNLILVLKHEPWRDEIHAWLMSKTYSIPKLFVESRFDGHPILWHLILMPFAKLNFPIITLSIINFILVLVSSYLFLFKTDFPLWFKIIALFTIPFTYTYSAIARNYTLILLLLVIIGVYYDKRYEKPILYSILICLLIHTHSLAWGIVAGLTITFHFVEIYKYLRYKNVSNIKDIVFGLFLIICNTLIVVFELYGTSNTDFSTSKVLSSALKEALIAMFTILLAYFITSFATKKYWKEFLVLLFAFLFQIAVYCLFYSSVLYQRKILIFMVALFYLILLSSAKINKKVLSLLCALYILVISCFGIKIFYKYVRLDLKYNFSSAQEMADYINNNLPPNTTVLVDASVIGQSIIPYLDTATFYDITYDTPVDCANVSHNKMKIRSALTHIKDFSGNYIIICNNFVKLNPEYADLVFETGYSMINEHYTLYYIH